MRILLAAATIAALTFVLSASASVGRFDPQGKIVVGGTSVRVSGPFTLDADESGFTVHASIVQNGAQASGDSSYLTGSSWSATLSGSKTFHAGPANAKATATVTKSDGSTETYTWTQQIALK